MFWDWSLLDILKNFTDVVPQKAAGRYNVDFYLPKYDMCIDLFGGNWHASAKHFRTFDRRNKYLIDNYNSVIVIWVRKDNFNPSKISKKIIDISEEISGNYIMHGGGDKSKAFNSKFKYYIN